MSFPCNAVEQALAAALGEPDRLESLLDALAGGQLWIPLPGGITDPSEASLPTTEIAGARYVPVFSSLEQLRKVAANMPFVVLDTREFARSLPPEVGIAVNPEGDVGIPLPPPYVLRLAQVEPATGARVRLAEPEVEPFEFLAAAVAQFQTMPVVLTARRALAWIEAETPSLFIGLELDRWTDEDRREALLALERAISAAPAPMPVNMVLLDVAQDPVGYWMLDHVEPFYVRDETRD